MSFCFNASLLLKRIRSSETNTGKFEYTDEHGQEISHEGKLIHLRNIKRMIDSILARYNEKLKEVAFFGEEIPVDIFPTIDISNLVDNQNNHSPGYSFIDDPRNGFDQYRQAYGRWFLSDPKRAEKFVHSDGITLTWFPGRTQAFLKDMESCRDLLAVGTTMSGGPSGRATEVARRIFREMSGTERNLRILYHNCCLTDVIDKTSFKLMNEKFVPHVPTREYSTALILSLVFFRPFEQYLVEELFPSEPEVIRQYRHQLWPGMKETMTNEHLSDLLG